MWGEKQMGNKQIGFLVGDNPFHGISHLSQERARARLGAGFMSDEERASQLVNISLQNGAHGFMFSVSETTLSALKSIPKGNKPELYAIVPYAYEYARLATSAGGFSGLAQKVIRQIVFSRNIFTVARDFVGLVRFDPSALLKTYLIYEISRIKSAAGKDCNLTSVMLHEIVTDMCLAFDLDWVFKYYVDFLLKRKIQPGFETRNFAYLVDKFNQWNIDLTKTAIVAPFNKVGFQMNPSKVACEKALERSSGARIIAMSVLAAGYLKPSEAITYVDSLPNITEVVVGVSNENQARETFRFFAQNLKQS
jgi:hypothetical protein